MSKKSSTFAARNNWKTWFVSKKFNMTEAGDRLYRPAECHAGLDTGRGHEIEDLPLEAGRCGALRQLARVVPFL